MKRMGNYALVASALLLTTAAIDAGCSKSPKYDTNLLKNSSFENVGSDGIPKGWKLALFRGSPDEPSVRYGIDTLAVDGKRSWFFQGDPGTRRWYFLQQEVKVSGAANVRLRGWVQGEDVHAEPEQLTICCFLLTFYDKDHHRFQVERAADRSTPTRRQTYPWEEQAYAFPVPEGTHYIAVSCLLSMNGTAWFDNVSLEIPRPTPWQTATTKNYVFHWLPGHPMPPGAREAQQQRFDAVANQLGVTSDVVIKYYFYPDSLTIAKMTGTKGKTYVDWEDYEFHSIQPGDDHEVVHFITDPVGRPPRSIAEGTVVWIQNRWGAKSLDDQLNVVVKANKITPFTQLFDTNLFQRSDLAASIPTAAAFVKWVVERWGRDTLMELYRSINGMDSYSPIASGFEAVTHMPMAQAQDEFRLWMFSHYGKK
jgi:hypothetical protein